MLSVVLVAGALFSASYYDIYLDATPVKETDTPSENPPGVLPILSITTNGEHIEKEETVIVDIAVYEQGDTEKEPDFISTGEINYRGNSSYFTFDKKSYRLRFREDGDIETQDNYPLFGMESHFNWVLNGPFLDRTLVRNNIVYEKARELFEWAPDTEYFELYVDDEYQGVYLGTESVSTGQNRLNLERFGLITGETAYLVRRDRSGTNENPIDTYGSYAGYTSNELSVSYPGTDITEAQLEWIEQDISEFEMALYSDDFADPELGYAKYIDVDSFVNYYVLNEFTMNIDAGNLSTYMYKKLNDKLQITVWDFNNSFDNHAFQNYTDEFFVTENAWFSRLLQDRAFVDKVVDRYHELREGILSDESWYDSIDSSTLELSEAIDRNFEVWGYTFMTGMIMRDDPALFPTDHEHAVELLKDTIAMRGEFLDNNIGTLYEHCVN